jgi:hypothetical protein
MTTAVKHLLESFQRLSTNEQHEAMREILRRNLAQPYGPLTDEALAEIADESFLDLDQREAADERA